MQKMKKCFPKNQESLLSWAESDIGSQFEKLSFFKNNII